MGNRPPRTEESRRLMAELRRRRLRRRRLLVTSAIVCLVLVAGGIAVGTSLVNTAPPTGSYGEGPNTVHGFTTTATGDNASTAATDPAIAAGSTTAPSSGNSTSSAQTPRPTTAAAIVTTTTAVKRPSTTTQKQAAAATPATAPGGGSGVSNAIVVIDPGHQGPTDLSYEAIGPGSSTTKYKMSKGAFGVATGLPESEVNLAISFRLREELQARGITVVMTRTSEDVNISNIERAKMANEAGAQLFIRIHCDAFDNSSARGIHVLYPASLEGWTDDIYSSSRRAARLAQSALVAATGANDRGLDEREDMTGFNWSNVPVIMPELGFMTNPDEDRLLATSAYQQKLAVALADATVRFLNGE